MPNLDPSQIRVAATGAFWKAPLGTTLPIDSTTAWNAAFVNLGYTTDVGFTITQNLKTQLISGWQSTEPLRLINTSLDRKIAVESLESDKQNLSLAWGGATVNSTGVPVGGSVTIGTGGVLTTSTPHGFSVGSVIFLGPVTTSTGILAAVNYFVVAVGSTTTLTVSATLNGTPLTTTAGTATTITSASQYSVTIPDTAVSTEFALGIDWSDGGYNQRLVIPRCTLLTLPVIKFTRLDAVKYPIEFQVLKPIDGSQSILPYGLDWAATS